MFQQDIVKLLWTNFGGKSLSIGQNCPLSIVGDPFAIFSRDLEDIL